MKNITKLGKRCVAFALTTCMMFGLIGAIGQGDTVKATDSSRLLTIEQKTPEELGYTSRWTASKFTHQFGSIKYDNGLEGTISGSQWARATTGGTTITNVYVDVDLTLQTSTGTISYFSVLGSNNGGTQGVRTYLDSNGNINIVDYNRATTEKLLSGTMEDFGVQVGSPFNLKIGCRGSITSGATLDAWINNIYLGSATLGTKSSTNAWKAQYTDIALIAGDITVAAPTDPTPKDYNITYNLDGGVNGINPTNYSAKSSTITLQDATKSGYEFGGWYLDETFITQIEEIPAGTLGDITLYAKWNDTSPEAKGYTKRILLTEYKYQFASEQALEDKIYTGGGDWRLRSGSHTNAYLDVDISLPVSSNGSNGQYLAYGGTANGASDCFRFYLTADGFNIYDVKNSTLLYANTQSNLNIKENTIFNLKIGIQKPNNTSMKLDVWINNIYVFGTTLTSYGYKESATCAMIQASETNTITVDTPEQIKTMPDMLPEELGYTSRWTASKFTYQFGSLKYDSGLEGAISGSQWARATTGGTTITNVYVDVDLTLQTSTGTTSYFSVLGSNNGGTQGVRTYLDSNGNINIVDYNRTTTEKLLSGTMKDFSVQAGSPFNLKIGCRGSITSGATLDAWVNNIYLGSATLGTASSTNAWKNQYTDIAVIVGDITVAAPKSLHKYVSDISSYRTEGYGSYTTPTVPTGMVFAGWFSDRECTAAISTSKTSGAAYAKFVDEDVLTVGAQVRTNSGDTPTYDIRFSTSVDSARYRRIGFRITYKNETKKIATQEAHLYLTDINGTIYKPEDFSSLSRYFMSYTLLGFTDADDSFDVTGLWETLDGTLVTGTNTYTKTISDGLQ